MPQILQGDCLEILPTLSRESISLLYTDPPFNTGKTQRRISTDLAYEDTFEDFESFLMLRLEAALPVLTPNGSLLVHLDYREVHYIKVALDKLLGRDHFMNELVWTFDYGGRSKTKWSNKHNTILWYVKNPQDYIFNYDAIDRIPYMAPELVGPAKAAKGKVPTSCWLDSLQGTDVIWQTIVHTNGAEKTGYPTQKPLGLLNRLVRAHSNPGDTVLDIFAGSGSAGEAAKLNQRDYILIDSNPDAIDVMHVRLRKQPA